MSVPKLRAQHQQKNAELNSTGARQTHVSVNLPIAKTTVGSRGWIELFSFSMAVTGSKQIWTMLDTLTWSMGQQVGVSVTFPTSTAHLASCQLQHSQPAKIAQIFT
jgi:hypothetical protein